MDEQMIGTTVAGEYELTGWLGKGRHGVVFQGQDSEAWEVTVSFLDYQAAAAAGRLDEPFQQALARFGELMHPGLLLPYDAGIHDGTPYLIRSHSYAHPIAGEMALAPLAMERVIHIGRELCDLLALLHTATPLHGALNRQTVLLKPTPDFPQVKLTGFAPYPERLPPAGPDTLPDELPYLAPEQWTGGDLTAQTDLYGAGAMIYELATGQAPYPAEAIQRAGTATWRQPPPDMSELNDRVPASLAALVMALLRPRVGDRPASAGLVRDRLAHIGQNDLLPPRRPPAPLV